MCVHAMNSMKSQKLGSINSFEIRYSFFIYLICLRKNAIANNYSKFVEASRTNSVNVIRLRDISVNDKNNFVISSANGELYLGKEHQQIHDVSRQQNKS